MSTPLTRRQTLQLLGAAAIIVPLPGIAELAQADDSVLTVDEAFKLSFEVLEEKIRLTWKIAKGCALYKSRISVQITKPSGLTVKDPAWPPSITHTDPYFGKQEVYLDALSLEYPVLCAISGASGLELAVGYQGCAQGLCYPPQTRKLVMNVPAKACEI